MRIRFKVLGKWEKTFDFLNYVSEGKQFNNIEPYVISGLNALIAATPKDSGLTASSWDYSIVEKNGKIKITYYNNGKHTDQGTPIAILIQYGHGTRSGYYVEGIDYINPALQPIFNDIAEQVWTAIKGA